MFAQHLNILIPVHPHVCGELKSAIMVNLCGFGSSPRVWGTPGTQLPVCSYIRFIPTCVGNSIPEHVMPVATSVHPHVCGELVQADTNARLRSGSSPRVWGTRRYHQGRPILVRFIPTCVGNSTCWLHSSRGRPVHPHVCGELNVDIGFLDPGTGSSPRVWGTHPFRECLQDPLRFIPTCVGNSSSPVSSSSNISVHPHVCGELLSVPVQTTQIFGSSPRVWGTRV